MALTPTKVFSTLAKLQPLLRNGVWGELSIRLTNNTRYKEHPKWRVLAYIVGYESMRIDVTQDTSESDFKEAFIELRNELKQ